MQWRIISLMGIFNRFFGRALLFLTLVGAVALAADVGQAFAVGTIQGGRYNVSVRGVPVELQQDNTEVTLSPAGAGSSVAVDDGNITVSNVPAGVYSVTIKFELSRETCSNILSIAPNFIPTVAIANFISGGTVSDLFVSQVCSGDGVFTTSRTFTNITVRDGQTVTLPESNNPNGFTLGEAIQVDPETGLPILQCEGEGISGLVIDFTICPILEMTFRAIDISLNYIIVPLLAINPLTVNDPGTTDQSQIYQIWDNIRNFTNILFIFVFFVMVYWQATGSFYGVKRILPRLIVMAIAANLSFFICQIFIDISNILGVGIANLITGAIGGQPVLEFNSLFIGIGALFGLPVVLLIAMFFLILITAFLMLVGAVVLIIRQVLLVFLVIVSPVAFVAGVLPNTANVMKSWFNIFLRLVLMYPMIMLLIAAGRIAATIITSIGTQF